MSTPDTVITLGCRLNLAESETIRTMLAAAPGCTIEICAYGREAEDAIAALADLVNRKFDED